MLSSLIKLLSLTITIGVGFYFYPVTITKPVATPEETNIPLTTTVDFILVEKNKHLLSVYHHNKLLKKYRIALGPAPRGHKQYEGDGKTPEGLYTIIQKNPKSHYHLALKISYPNEKDKRQAKARRVSPGGDILIHGLEKKYAWLGKLHRQTDWTLGCIALTNPEIEELYAATPSGTKIEIRA
jgi:murein L,D-transpeptidase YafK